MSGANKTTGGGSLRLGGLSRYLMEKAQNNDADLGLSPATLQTLMHAPLRSSDSNSKSKLNPRSCFESPKSSDESPPLTQLQQALRNADAEEPKPASKEPEPPAPVQPQKSSADSNLSGGVNPCNGLKFSEPLEESHKTLVQQGESGTGTGKLNSVRKKAPGSVQPLRPTDTNSSGGLKLKDPRSCFESPESSEESPKTQVNHAETTGPTGKSKSAKKKAPASASAPPSTKKQSGWKFLSEQVRKKEFLILEQLGKGGCGEVTLVMEKNTRKQYALKIVHLNGLDEVLVQECVNEVEMLTDLKGTDLVVDIELWELNKSEKTMKILMEKGQCDLNQTISRANKSNKPIKLIKMKFIWESLLIIVDKIHCKGIVHADLKPANFVWVNDKIKLIDFGIASRLQSDLTSIAMPNPKGTLNFVSPEIIRQDEGGRSKLSPKSDIWALGCILYLMVYGKTPFEHISHPVTKMNAIMHGDIMYPQLPPHLLGSKVVNVLKLCFQTDYKIRPSAAELLQHPFLQA